MSAIKHTPGPWKHEDRTYVYALNEQGSNRFYVDVQRGRANGELTQLAELLANARLIAAAPDLLEACEHFMKSMEAAMTDGLQLNLPMHEQAMRAAIRKAKGE